MHKAPNGHSSSRRHPAHDRRTRVVNTPRGRRKTFFPNVPLPKARTLILVGATLGRAQLRGRPLTLSALCRQIEMPYATAERRVRDLIEAGWVRRLDHHFFLNLERLQEPTYASYFEYVKTQVTVTHKKLSKMEKQPSQGAKRHLYSSRF